MGFWELSLGRVIRMRGVGLSPERNGRFFQMIGMEKAISVRTYKSYGDCRTGKYFDPYGEYLPDY